MRLTAVLKNLPRCTNLGRSPFAPIEKAPREKQSRFIDHIRVIFQGGHGGDGCISMLHLYKNQFAGPDGGNGGCGGHIVLRANSRIKSLNSILSSYRGIDGPPGRGKHLFGANAEHLFVDVPIGTMVSKARPKDVPEHEVDPEKSDVVALLDQEGSMFIAARGGAGGKGNAHYLSNHNRHPRVAEAGAKGERNVYELKIRVYAHVGLIGLPNSGKSTLLKTLTRAQVKIGDYAFTTLYPQVGVIEFDDYTQVAISDLPGLIEDSHKNRGLGLRFLRHVERCVCLLYVIDLTSDPVAQLDTLVRELESHKKGLSKRPHLILANKIDDECAVGNLARLEEYVAINRPETKILTGSSLRGDNLGVLRDELRGIYDKYQMQHADEPNDGLIW